MACEESSSITETSDGGLKFLIGLIEKCSHLDEVPGCSAATYNYDVCCPMGCCPTDTT